MGQASFADRLQRYEKSLVRRLLMRWDNGSGLNVVYGEDIVRKVGDRRAE